MNRYKICVYAIAKNEEKFVDRWMDAVSEADMVVVVDTGSTDKTVEKLKARGAFVYQESISPWRFDNARNSALNHIPMDIDICVSNDLDEIFETGWRGKLESTWEPKHTRARYLFTWSYHPDGSPNKQFTMEKIHRRKDFKWIHPVHEVLDYTGNDPDDTVWVPGLVLNHHPDPSKPRTQYLPLLELSAQENPDNDRVIFWLGREYFYYNKHHECIETLKKHLALPRAVWDEERCASMRFIAKSYQALGNIVEARSWYFRAIAECPHIREPYMSLAKFAHILADWPLLYLTSTKALSLNTQTGSYLMEPEVWSSFFYDMAALSCFYLGLYQDAYDYNIIACNLAPDDIRLTNNLKIVESILQQNRTE